MGGRLPRALLIPAALLLYAVGVRAAEHSPAQSTPPGDARNAGGAAERDAVGKTALHRAAEAGDARAAEALLAAGADVNARDAYGNVPLHLAARRGQYGLAAALLVAKGADAKALAWNRYTPLHLAAWGGNAKIVKLLLHRGTDVHAQDHDWRTPLHYASTRQAAEALLAGGAEVNARFQPWMRTPLLDAAMHGFPDVVEALLDHGADLQATNCSHFTALHWAAWGGRTQVVEVLLKRGADARREDDAGHTPLFWAEFRGHREAAGLLSKKMDGATARPATGQR